MGVLRQAILSLLAIFLLSMSWQAFGSSSSSSGSFIRCLLSHSQPCHPISRAIYTPNNSSYSSVLQAYIRNLRFNTSTTNKPFLILTALHESHIQAAVLCAQKHNMQMKIRSGGHDYEGVSYVSQVVFFILDMFNLRSIHIDVGRETAWVQAGATLGEVYYRIAEKSKKHGFPAGVCPTVGVGGHFSGGGYGNMMRKYGLSVDNIVDAQLVDVNGRLLDRKSMGEDLFWAIRGGGGASFGVVISYKIKLVRVPETVTVFRVAKTMEENATDIVHGWMNVADKLDNNLFIRLFLDVVNIGTHGKKTGRATFVALFLGDSEKLVSVMSKSFPEMGLKKSDCNETSWLQSVLFWTNFPLGTANDVLLSRTPQTLNYLKRKSDYVKNPISKDGLEVIWKRLIELKAVILKFYPYGGRMGEIPAEETPFPHRAGNLAKIQYAVNWNEAGKEVTDYYINLTRKVYRYMTPFVSKNPREAYFNYKDLDLGINHNGKNSYREGRVYGIKYFKGNFNRLVKIKTKVDPGNFFRNEQSIPTLPIHKQIKLNWCLQSVV
ncbi:berberine bridge enzyme-like 8 [Corylus avellana]|uniref:berberine bridge enzyme-like 8 n=1 Tax=Corylus avellana TaxID=13451 RepID=UPI001E215976|nr:berberine bridge enzyme-like 8 [Corylus avellana]XP_059439191.1 berberine bridge enzyme-like 8 [Corylus avellana]